MTTTTNMSVSDMSREIVNRTGKLVVSANRGNLVGFRIEGDLSVFWDYLTKTWVLVLGSGDVHVKGSNEHALACICALIRKS